LSTKIPEDKIEEIRNTADILDIVSESVVLKKTGKNYQGLCPFHTEKTPSFSVNPSRQIFYCFGCGTGGNVFSFLMKKEGLSFPEVVRDLARRYAIDIPVARMTPEQKQRMNEREQVFGINRLAMSFFTECLSSDAGKTARHYLVKRGIQLETIEKFQLGFAPEGWRHLVNFFQKKRVPLAMAEKAGLIVNRKSGSGYYDAFRNRIVFPIFNISKQSVGFGGRVMDDAMPKYINSPETPVYNKSRLLYGCHLAKSAARSCETIFVVEGYFDLIALQQQGFTNSVATLGTALTSEHVKILKGFVGRSGKVILVFDSDTAGIKAAERSIPVFTAEFVDVLILVLPEGHDPDSYLLEFSPQAFEEKAETALNAVMFLIDSSVQRHGLSLEGKIRIVSDLKEPLAAITDPISQSVYVTALSEKVAIDEAAVMGEIRNSTARRERGKQHLGRIGPQASDGLSPGPNGENSRQSRLSNRDEMEQRLITMMFHYPAIIPEIQRKKLLERFGNQDLIAIGKAILMQQSQKGAPADIFSHIEDSRLKSRAAELAIGGGPFVVEDQKDMDGCQKLIVEFETNWLRRQKELITEIKAAEAANDTDRLMQLLREKQDRASRQGIG